MNLPPDTPQPVLRTARLLLRPFVPADAPAVHAIVSDREIASTTASFPHPYPDGMAAEWIERNARIWTAGEGAVFAVTTADADAGALVAAFGIHLDRPHDRAEVGYWVARAHWGRGIATEAGRAVLDWAFPHFGLNRAGAIHFARNPASGAVLRKLGMRHEGTLRGHVKKWGVYEDVELYGLLASDRDAPA